MAAGGAGGPWGAGIGGGQRGRWEKAELGQASFSEAWKERDGEDGERG